jgi:hypothetical protein
VLTPPGNRFIAPLAVGAALIVWLRGTRPQARPPEAGLAAMSP